jgi:hypothetical protein
MPGIQDDPELSGLLDWAQQHQAQNKRFLDQLKKRPVKVVDDAFHEAHDAVFQSIDCLSCANCCKTLPPLLLQKDIDRIAKHLKMKAGDFIQRYVVMDEDGDFVLNQSPCPFLAEDNYCRIYEVRPGACADYPHTRNRKMVNLMGITELNSLSCPAVAGMLRRMQEV